MTTLRRFSIPAQFWGQSRHIAVCGRLLAIFQDGPVTHGTGWAGGQRDIVLTTGLMGRAGFGGNVAVGNVASGRVLQKAGFSEVGTEDYDGTMCRSFVYQSPA